MADDPRNYIEQTQARAVAYEGKELSPDEMAKHFAKAEMDERVNILDQLDRDMSGGELNLNEAARLHGYVKALQGMHHTLRKVGR
ncbi:hypothetical protein AB8Z38_06740 [Bradyrhizobium sp. LLZ17]|uniref:Uncharacterized protein n=1 Tax=Bradyrhizobium sp. LLZ17 TaxID=3239388 RepID=A0AB39XMB0_9BRAD